jgi:hypothetical protein
MLSDSAIPGVACGNDVEVRCTASSVSVLVPGRYLLQLPLPFGIKDEADSVKFSSKKQPPTLTVTLAVDSSIVTPAAALSASASAFTQSSSTGSRGAQLPGQQQQQQPVFVFGSSSRGFPVSPPGDVVHPDFAAVHPFAGPQSTWPQPWRAALDFLDRSGANDAADSMLWMLNPHSAPPEDQPVNLLPLTIKNVVLALIALLLWPVVAASAIAYVLVSGVTLRQGDDARKAFAVYDSNDVCRSAAVGAIAAALLQLVLGCQLWFCFSYEHGCASCIVEDALSCAVCSCHAVSTASRAV